MSPVLKKPRKIADSNEPTLENALKPAKNFIAACYRSRSFRGRSFEEGFISDTYKDVFGEYPDSDLLPGLAKARVYYKLANDGLRQAGLFEKVTPEFQQNLRAALTFKNSYEGFTADFVEAVELLGEATENRQKTKGDKIMAKKAKRPKKIKQETKPKTSSKRQTILGHTVTGVLRWLGANGYDSKQAAAVLKFYKVSVADSTLVTEVCAGRVGKHGDPAQLTRNQQAEIKKHIPASEKPKAAKKKAAPKKKATSKKAPAKKKPAKKAAKAAPKKLKKVPPKKKPKKIK